MKFYEIEDEFASPPSAVWAALTDKAVLESGLGIERIEGELAPGARFKLWATVSPGRAFSLRVSEWRAPARMVWRSGMPLGLFTGVRQFNLRPSGTGTLFQMREEFTGPMLPLIWKAMPDLEPAFRAFVDGLRAAVDKPGATP